MRQYKCKAKAFSKKTPNIHMQTDNYEPFL